MHPAGDAEDLGPAGMGWLTVLLAALTMQMTPALAGGPSGKLTLELNDLQWTEGSCRAVYVAHNALDRAVDSLTLRIVAFDRKGKASLFLTLNIGAMPIDKTRVLRFDLGKMATCGDLSRIILDDVTECTGTGLSPSTCLPMIVPSSRTDVPFDL